MARLIRNLAPVGLVFLIFLLSFPLSPSVALSAPFQSDQPTVYQPFQFLDFVNPGITAGTTYQVSITLPTGTLGPISVQAREAGKLSIVAPFYLDPASGLSAPAECSASIQGLAGALDFSVTALPELTSGPGEGVSAFLDGAVQLHNQTLTYLETMEANSGLSLAAAKAEINKLLSWLNDWLDQFRSTGQIVLDPDRPELTLTGEDLAAADRLLYAQVQGIIAASQAEAGAEHPAPAVQKAPDWGSLYQQFSAYLDDPAKSGDELTASFTFYLIEYDLSINTPWGQPLARQAQALTAVSLGLAISAAANLAGRGGTQVDVAAECSKFDQAILKMEGAVALMNAALTTGAVGDVAGLGQPWIESVNVLKGSITQWKGHYCNDDEDDLDVTGRWFMRAEYVWENSAGRVDLWWTECFMTLNDNGTVSGGCEIKTYTLAGNQIRMEMPYSTNLVVYTGTVSGGAMSGTWAGDWRCEGPQATLTCTNMVWTATKVD